MKKIGILITILILVVNMIAGISIKFKESTAMLGKEKTKYTATADGSRIANIPYDDYLTAKEAIKEHVDIKGISESNTSAENTALIQQKINSLSENGGGVIYIPEGTYKIEALELKSNITLYIEKGAELVSLDYDEYSSSGNAKHAVIYADNAKNIKIKGGGTINGMGISFTNEPKTEKPLYALKSFNMYTRVIEARKRLRTARDSARPNIINFSDCKNVELESIRLKDSAAWTCVLNQCVNVTVNSIIIDNHMHVANTDGIDIIGGKDIRINNCFIATADDGIVLKPTNGSISQVSISDCIISSFANCFKIGTETEFDVSKVTVNNCEFFMPDGITGGYSGIAIESADGANIKDVTVSNIEMTGISSPLLIWLGNRLKYNKDTVGSIDNVEIENITAKNVEMPSAVTGIDGYKITNVTLRNFDITYRDTQERLDVKKNVLEKPMSDYPEITRVSHIYFISHELSRYWDLPCYGIFIRHTENVKLENFNCVPRSESSLDFATIIDSDTVI